jgi:hypothetical protein
MTGWQSSGIFSRMALLLGLVKYLRKISQLIHMRHMHLKHIIVFQFFFAAKPFI